MTLQMIATDLDRRLSRKTLRRRRQLSDTLEQLATKCYIGNSAQGVGRNDKPYEEWQPAPPRAQPHLPCHPFLRSSQQLHAAATAVIWLSYESAAKGKRS
jgi:hypothetical protein